MALTKTETKSQVNVSLMELPILKHFNENEINTQVDSFRKGEKGLFSFLKLGALLGFGYLVCVYILPPLFQALGQFVAVAATAILCIASIIFAPVIIKGLRLLARGLHKTFIKHDPFAQLDIERQKMVDNQQIFRVSKGKILALKNDMEIEADKSEKDATTLTGKILSTQTKAEDLKNKLDAMVKKDGIAAKQTDEWVNGNSDLVKLLSDSSRIANKLNQSKDFVQKYGSRAAVMKKFNQKLVMVETNMEIKIADFDATIEMLKKDFEFSQKSRAATDAAKSAMGFTKGWELEYALDVVTSTIASDIAITAGNLKDIDTLTSTYSMDSDELYTNLNSLADNIRVGKDTVPTAKTYTNPDYKLTESDKLKSGGFQDLM